MQDILDSNLEELEGLLEDWKAPRYHARQIFSWVYQKGATDFEQMSNLPLELRKRLKQNFCVRTIVPSRIATSRDGTQKFLFELKGGHFIEAVVIPAEGRSTACISSQAGCRFGCRFCASGMRGFKRNLSPAELLSQIHYIKYNSAQKNISHIVFMGTGEPLDNYDNVLKAIRVINAEWGFAIGARRITVSTSGIIPGLSRLAEEKLQVELSVSLHAADQALRSRLMPVNKIYPLDKLLKACADYIAKTNRQITFEYVLLKGINSDLQNARKLSTIIKRLKLGKINLIPANAIPEYGIEPPNTLEVLLFRDALLKAGVTVTLRKSRGQDIEAACGQLRLGYEKK